MTLVFSEFEIGFMLGGIATFGVILFLAYQDFKG